MQGIWRNRVNSAVSKQLTLEKTLHTLWDWLKYSGLHPNLLLISVQQRSASDILRRVFTLITLLLVLVLFVFESIQLIIKSWSVQNMVDVVPNVLLVLPLLLSLISQYHFWSRHHQIKQFLEDWKIIERQMICFKSSKLKQDINRLCIHFYFIHFLVMISLTLLNLFDPERSFFMTYYPIIRETFDVLPVSVITSVVFVFDSIFGFTCLTIPLISFYVIACYVESLYEEWESSSKNEQFLRMIWQRYESILHLVDRANELYGAVINGFNSYIILICCMTVFYALELFQRSLILFLNVIIFFIIKFGYIVRFS